MSKGICLDCECQELVCAGCGSSHVEISCRHEVIVAPSVMEKIVSDYVKGYGINHLVDTYGLSYYKVHSILTEAGIIRKRFALGPAELEELKKLSAEGFKAPALARKFGVSRQVIYRALKRI